MRSPPDFWRAGSVSRSRCRRARPTRRASWRPHPEAGRDPALLDPPQLVANVRRQLELLGLDRPLQAIAKLGRARNVGQFRWQRRDVAPADVPRIAVDPAEKITQARLERLVTVGAPKTTGGAKIGERPLAERAHRRLALGGGHLLVDRLEEIVDL